MKTNRIETVFVLGIFCVFAAGVLITVVLAAGTYANMNEIAEAGHNERILLSYIRTTVRNADVADAVSVGYFHGSSALFISEVLGGRDFVTVIYLHDGVVRELFREADGEFLPEEGVAIVTVDFLRFEALNRADVGLIRVETEIGDALIFPRSESNLESVVLP